MYLNLFLHKKETRSHLPYLTEVEYIKISFMEFHQKTPSKWSAPIFLSCFKFSISKQDNATFPLCVIQLISHFPLGFVCFGQSVYATSVINFFVSLGGGEISAHNYMLLLLVASIKERMTASLYWRPKSIFCGTQIA